MSVFDVTIITITLVNFVFSAIIYIHSRRTSVVTVFAVFAFSVSLWALATFLMTSSSVPFEAFKASVMLHYISGNVVFWSLLWFSVFYPDRMNHSLFLPVPFSIFNAIILVLILSTRFLFIGIEESALLADRIDFNMQGYIILSIITVSMFLLSQIFLGRKYFVASGEERTKIGGIFLATSIAGSFGLFSNLILPGLGNFTLFYIGPVLATPLFVGIMVYAIIKFKVFDLRVITAEIFTALLMIALAAEFILASTSAEVGARGVVFLVAAVFGVFLIKSVYREIQAREEIERLNQTMSEFLAVASHQIRSPLTHIKGALSLIKDGDYGPVDRRAQSLLNDVSLSTVRLISLVSDILDKSRMDSGRMQYVYSDFDFNELVDSVVAEFKLPAASKGIAIVWQKGTAAALSIRGDREKLRQVLFNLVDNALKYTRSGAIEIKNKSEGDALELSVKDSGSGMSKDTLERLFQKFSRASEKETSIQGTGLGLYVAKRIIDDHNGELWAESEGEGKGSIFHLRLTRSTPGVKLTAMPKADARLPKAA